MFIPNQSLVSRFLSQQQMMPAAFLNTQHFFNGSAAFPLSMRFSLFVYRATET
jgi:hypothetical protein